jgi:hypothetical protein
LQVHDLLLKSNTVQELEDNNVIQEVLSKLLYVPNLDLKPRIIRELDEYIQKELVEGNGNLKLFAVRTFNEWKGFVISQIEPEYRSYGRKCGTFGWLHAMDLDSCRCLMNACEAWMRENNIKKLRGPINYPKLIGGCGIQIEGFQAPLMNGVNFNYPGFRELGFLKALNYKMESTYACVEVTKQNWSKGNHLNKKYRLGYLNIKEHVERKDEILALASNSFQTVLPDSIGGNTRFKEMIRSYSLASNLPFYDDIYFQIRRKYNFPQYIEAWNACDFKKTVPWAPLAFDRNTNDIVGVIYALPNIYQLWSQNHFSHCNVDTVMIKK